jgi:hypothetical protein
LIFTETRKDFTSIKTIFWGAAMIFCDIAPEQA